jgi:hypothetical protein
VEQVRGSKERVTKDTKQETRCNGQETKDKRQTKGDRGRKARKRQNIRVKRKEPRYDQ